MANTLFFISLFLIWIMLLYHMFLMEGGYLHFRTFEKPIDEWAKKWTKFLLLVSLSLLTMKRS